MIFGNQSKGTIIAAQNMLGYDSFIDSDFTKPFNENEPLEMLYPPDHPNSGSKYVFDTPLGVDTLGTFSFEWGRGTYHFPEVNKLKVNKDYVFPYQSEIDIVFAPTLNSGMRPLTDRAITADNGVDAFFLKGSVIRGKISGAKRFYAGPFKGFTKEIQDVCQGATAVNLMDGSDCAGYLKGTFYEHGFDPAVHNLFNYADQSNTVIDVKSPFNLSFMEGTPYHRLGYNWINTRNRFKRPIPYSMLSGTGKGVSAVVISKRHAIVSADADIDSENLRFYSGITGFVVPTVTATASTFKQMWDAIGFINENSSSETLAKFNEMKPYFDGIKILTFSQDLPDDIQPIWLMDTNTSDPLFYSLAIGQEARGHHGTFCPPIKSSTFDPTSPPSLLFGSSQECSSMPSPSDHSMPNTLRTIAIARGDIGSPVITYHYYVPIFVGLVSEVSFADDQNQNNRSVSAKICGTGMGSSKPIQFPWGATFTPFSFLNAYLSIGGGSANTTQLIRTNFATNETYPYPPIDFESGPPYRSTRIDVVYEGTGLIFEATSGIEEREIIVDDYTQCVANITLMQTRMMVVVSRKLLCGCSIENPGIDTYFCINGLCDWLRSLLKQLGMPTNFPCPTSFIDILRIADTDWELVKRKLIALAHYFLTLFLTRGPASIGPCEVYKQFNDEFFKKWVDPVQGMNCPNPIIPLPNDAFPERISDKCKKIMEEACRGYQTPPIDPGFEMINDAIACFLLWGVEHPNSSDQEKKMAFAECARQACLNNIGNGTIPGSGGVGLADTYQCPLTCESLYRALAYGVDPC
jgi:hypothetical protein